MNLACALGVWTVPDGGPLWVHGGETTMDSGMSLKACLWRAMDFVCQKREVLLLFDLFCQELCDTLRRHDGSTRIRFFTLDGGACRLR